MLDVINLEFEYHDRLLLSDINFNLKPGELLHLRGANGAGKTTLLRVLAGLFHPLSGQILYQGQSIHQQLDVYQQNLCFVGHKPGISPMLTVKENLTFDMNYQPSEQSVDALLEASELGDCANQLCDHLSAGQKRRVSLLRLYMSKKPLWFLDEPLVALDNHSVNLLMHHMQNHLKSGGMVLLTSHQLLPIELSKYKEYKL